MTGASCTTGTEISLACPSVWLEGLEIADPLVYDKHAMARQAISVTLDTENLTWLRGRVGAGGGRSVSDLLDQLVTEARKAGRVGPSRSVIGTIEIDASDPFLEAADAALQTLFDRSVGRPVMVRERRRKYAARGGSAKRRG